MRIAINTWFSGQGGTGSGQYTDRLMEWLPQVAPGHQFIGLAPARGHGSSDLDKVRFEQLTFPMATVRADVAHVPYWGSPLRPSVPTVVTVHDVIPLILAAYRGSARVRLYSRLVSASARRAALILTDSQASARDIVRLLRVDSSRVRVVYLAADPRFRPVPPEQQVEVRARLGLPERYILYLGGFDARKRVPDLLRAFAGVAAELNGVHLVVAGRLPDAGSALCPDPRPLARTLGLQGVVHFIGWVDEADKPALYSGALALAFPSEYEGFGLPPLEAMACGCPVVASAASSLPEVVGEGGILVPPSDEAELTRALRSIVVDAPLRAALAVRALSQAAGFSWERTARETVRAYEEVAGTRRKAGVRRLAGSAPTPRSDSSRRAHSTRPYRDAAEARNADPHA